MGPGLGADTFRPPEHGHGRRRAHHGATTSGPRRRPSASWRRCARFDAPLGRLDQAPPVPRGAAHERRPVGVGAALLHEERLPLVAADEHGRGVGRARRQVETASTASSRSGPAAARSPTCPRTRRRSPAARARTGRRPRCCGRTRPSTRRAAPGAAASSRMSPASPCHGRYVNDVSRRARTRAPSTATRSRTACVALKREWDPDDVFRLNQNIRRTRARRSPSPTRRRRWRRRRPGTHTSRAPSGARRRGARRRSA